LYTLGEFYDKQGSLHKEWVERQLKINQNMRENLLDPLDTIISLTGESDTFISALKSASSAQQKRKLTFDEKVRLRNEDISNVGKVLTPQELVDRDRARLKELNREKVNQAAILNDTRIKGTPAEEQARTAFLTILDKILNTTESLDGHMKEMKDDTKVLTELQIAQLQAEFGGLTLEEILALSPEQVADFKRAGAIDQRFLNATNTGVHVTVNNMDLHNPGNVGEIGRVVSNNLKEDGTIVADNNQLFSIAGGSN